MTESVVLAEVVRSGFVEGRHYGSVVVTAADGSVDHGIGAFHRPMFPRSASKPLQALAMIRSGLELDGPLLALAAASHSGEPFHLDGVRRILAGAGLDSEALRTPPDLPLDDAEREAWLRAGRDRTRIVMNCSGKHAAMLATCVARDWPTADYLAPEHPLQVAVRETVEEMTGEKVAAVAVDGCGAPLLAISLAGLARAFGRLAAAPPGTPEGRIAGAITAHPEYASGTRRDEAALIRAIPGLIAKSGAEAVYAAGLPDGRGVAVKVDDGSPRARPVVMAAVLARLGIDHPVLTRQREWPLLGGGVPVGAVRAAPVLDRW